MLTLTPQLLADIFEEFPIVQQAYAENVPKPASIPFFTLVLSFLSYYSSEKRNSGKGILAQSCLTVIGHLLVTPWLSLIQSLTSIWRRKMTVRFTIFGL